MFSLYLMKIVVWGIKVCFVKCGKLRVLGRVWIWVIYRLEFSLEEELEDDSCVFVFKISYIV